MKNYETLAAGYAKKVNELITENTKLKKFGWVWCKDELPNKRGDYVVSWGKGLTIDCIWWTGEEWGAQASSSPKQWLRAPEPMEEMK